MLFWIWFVVSIVVLVKRRSLLRAERAEKAVEIDDSGMAVADPTETRALEPLARMIVNLHRQGPGSISDRLYWYRDGKFMTITDLRRSFATYTSTERSDLRYGSPQTTEYSSWRETIRSRRSTSAVRSCSSRTVRSSVLPPTVATNSSGRISRSPVRRTVVVSMSGEASILVRKVRYYGVSSL